jgi:hypothetical protein
MTAAIKPVFIRVLSALGWVITAIGILAMTGALFSLYMLLVKGAAPGQPVFADVVV